MTEYIKKMKSVILQLVRALRRVIFDDEFEEESEFNNFGKFEYDFGKFWQISKF